MYILNLKKVMVEVKGKNHYYNMTPNVLNVRSGSLDSDSRVSWTVDVCT